MTSPATIPAIRRSITVAAPVERAFAVFTASFDTWWPAGFHIGEVDPAEFVLEGRAGGRWYERGVDGSECEWGRVLAWEPPHRFVVTWQINGRWEYDPDPEHASELELRFTALGPAETRVELEHRRVDRLAEARSLAGSVGGEDGWGGILARFANALVPTTFVHLAVHHPKPGCVDEVLEQMLEVDAAAQGAPGLIQIGAWRDERTDRLIGLAIWESKEAWAGSVEKIFSVVDQDRLDAALARDPDVFHLTPVRRRG